MEGNIADGVRFQTNWPSIVHLRADPFEKAPHESGMYIRWMADNMWLFVPVAGQIQEFLTTVPDYPFQASQVLNPGMFNQNVMMLQSRLQQLEAAVAK
ncbi:arylsulfatase [Vibrio astriarenae]|nr:arylsulfatase [Vibrio sp. C7]